MDNEKRKEPKGMSRDAFLEMFVKINIEEYNLPFKFVKCDC